MGAFVISLPVICCVLIPAVIGVGALVFRRFGKRPHDTAGQISEETRPLECNDSNEKDHTGFEIG